MRGRAGAEPPGLATLDGAQQLGLAGGAQLADLVEHERALIRELELARVGHRGARERAALVAEQFAFDQRIGNGGAVQRHQRLPRATALAVDQHGDHVLAGARFAGDQHRRIGGRDLAHEGTQAGGGGAVADQAVRGDRWFGVVERPERRQMQGQHAREFGVADAQADEVVRAGSKRLHGLGLLGSQSDDDDAGAHEGCTRRRHGLARTVVHQQHDRVIGQPLRRDRRQRVGRHTQDADDGQHAGAPLRIGIDQHDAAAIMVHGDSLPLPCPISWNGTPDMSRVLRPRPLSQARHSIRIRCPCRCPATLAERMMSDGGRTAIP